ncbi:MAG: hypothetical protein FK733_06565 [Asgard group archaeon]|nr:hypothetical protein [Asgard group archaeon]
MTDIKEILSSFEEALKSENFSSVEELIKQLEKLSETKSDVNEFYSQAVADALEIFKGKFSSNKVKKLISNVEALVEKNPEDDKLIKNYAKVLRTSLLAMSTKGQPNVMREIIDYLEILATNNPNNIVIHEELSLASHEIANYWKSRGDFKALRDRTQKFRKLAEKFPDNEKIKLNLTKALVLEIDSSRKSDISKIDSLLIEIQRLSESMPMNIGLQLEWVHAYRTAMDRSYEKPEDAKRWLSSMKKIAENRTDTSFKLELAKGYLNAIANLGDREQNKEELSKHLDELEMLADTTKDNLELQTVYAQGLIVSLKIIGISDKNLVKEILDELEELVELYPKNKIIIEVYVESLVGIIGLYTQEQNAKEITPLVKRFGKLDEKFPDDETIQKTYDMLMEQLKFLGFKREKKKPRRIGYM